MRTVDGCLKVGGGYISAAFNPAADLAASAAIALHGIDFDTMVGTGLSGALVVPRLAEALGKRWMVVRKPNDGSHSAQRGEGMLGRRWVFVDDFISTGATYFRVCKTIGDFPFDTAHVGSYLYEAARFEGPRTQPLTRLKIGTRDDWRETVECAEPLEKVERAMKRRRKFMVTRVSGTKDTEYEVKPREVFDVAGIKY